MSTRGYKAYEPTPPQRLELEVARPKLRLLLVAVLLALGVTAITLGFRASAAARSGWIEILSNASQTEDGSADFLFRYKLGKNGTAEYRAVTEVYTETSRRAWQVLHATESFEGVGNLCRVNRSPNAAVTVEPELYRVLEMLEQHRCRLAFLAPLYAQYDALFRSEDDAEAALYDPLLEPEAAAYAARISAFAADPDAVKLELLGDNRVCLRLSDEYAAFAREYGLDCFVDLYWMKNAFIADLIADELSARGLTHGYLASRDGFARCLDDSGERYSVKIVRVEDGAPTEGCELSYEGPMCVAELCVLPYEGGSGALRYRYADGVLRTPYLSLPDGLSRAAVGDLILCSPSVSCGELLLEALPLFLDSRFSAEQAEALTEREIYALCYEDDGSLYLSESAPLSPR